MARNPWGTDLTRKKENRAENRPFTQGARPSAKASALVYSPIMVKVTVALYVPCGGLLLKTSFKMGAMA